MSDNVSFFVKPKQLNKSYRNVKYTITYLPADKKWRWEVTFVTTTKYHDDAKTMVAAQKAAEKHIDETLKLRGK